MQLTVTGRQELVPTWGTGQRGASAVEYALLIALIAAVIVGAVGLLGLSVVDLLAVDLSP